MNGSPQVVIGDSCPEEMEVEGVSERNGPIVAGDMLCPQDGRDPISALQARKKQCMPDRRSS